MFIIEKFASNYFRTDLQLHRTPQEEVKFQQSTVCWPCEEPFGSLIYESCESSHTTQSTQSTKSASGVFGDERI